MNTKEAIEVIKHDLDLCLNDGIDKNDLFKAIDNIEDKLKRGEKFEKMWGDVYKEYSKNIYLDKFKQKYFPKGGS